MKHAAQRTGSKGEFSNNTSLVVKLIMLMECNLHGGLTVIMACIQRRAV